MLRTRWLFVALPFLAVAAQADDLVLVQKPIARRFPSTYCPLETRDVDPAQNAFGTMFTAVGPEVTLHFTVPNFTSFNEWGQNKLDNVVVVPRLLFEGNRGPSPGYEECYNDTLPGFPATDDSCPAFFFNRFPLSNLPFADLFDTDPTGDPNRAWDLTQGAYFLAQGDSTRCSAFSDPKPNSAPRVPEFGNDCTGGALGMGRETDGAILVKTSVRVQHLVAGMEYVVTGWWDIFTRTGPLTLTITAPAPATSGLFAMEDVGQTNGVDKFVRIADAATGVGTLIGRLGDHFVDTEAMAARPGPGGTSRIYAVDNNRLVELNPATGTGNVIGPVGFSDVDGIAFHPTTGVLYGVTYGSNKIIRIDPVTGAGTVVANNVLVSRRLEDLAFHPDGRAFILTGPTPRLWQVNIATGAVLRRWDLTGGTSLESLVWSPDGRTLYSAADRGDFKDLVTIDLTGTGTISFVSPQHSGFKDIEALIFVAPTTALTVRSWSPTDAPAPERRAMLYANVPNPFNPSTSIEYEIAAAGEVDLTVLDVAGRRIANLVHGSFSAGRRSVRWDGRDAHGRPVASGLYVARLQFGGQVQTRRMVLVR